MLVPNWIRNTRTAITGLALGFTAGLIALSGAVQMDAPPRGSSGPQAAPGSVPWLVERHDCWSGAAPPDMAGAVPGHAVVTWPGADDATYGGRRAVEAALEQVFGDEETPGLEVHAFCR